MNFFYCRSNGNISGDANSPVTIFSNKEKKTLDNNHIECSLKHSLKKVRFEEDTSTTNKKSYNNKRIERVEYRRKREKINRNQHNNGVGSGKKNYSCFNDRELLELDKNGIPDTLSEEILTKITSDIYQKYHEEVVTCLFQNFSKNI